MSRHFSASLLLDRPWSLNVDAIASALRTLFPAIGEVDSVHGQADDTDAGVLIVEGATVVVQSFAQPLPAKDMTPALRPLRAGGADEAASSHAAHVTISAGGALPGLEGAEAYAALVHFVAAATLSITPSSAVFWKNGWALSRAETFSASANMLLQGKMPVGTWISYAVIVPSGMQPADGTGMVTYGLRPFIGRELELAPRPCEARAAFQTLSTISRKILDTGAQLSDGIVVRSDDSRISFVVRERNYWLRRDSSAFVLIADDAVIDSVTLSASNG
jgi:hypothetical protein